MGKIYLKRKIVPLDSCLGCFFDEGRIGNGCTKSKRLKREQYSFEKFCVNFIYIPATKEEIERYEKNTLL